MSSVVANQSQMLCCHYLFHEGIDFGDAIVLVQVPLEYLGLAVRRYPEL